MNFKNRAWSLLFALLVTSPSYSEPPGRLTSLSKKSVELKEEIPSLSRAEVRAIAEEAYVWGWPMVYLHNCHLGLSMLSSPGRMAGSPVAPPNQLAMLTDAISATASVIPCPNRDVAYGFGVLDLSEDAVVLQVPDFGKRFWLYQLGDQRTESFAKLGRLHDTAPGFYLIVGPDWNEAVPPGFVDVLRCPTRLGYCIPRIALEQSDDDQELVSEAVQGIAMYPLKKFDGRFRYRDWGKYRWYPKVGSSTRDQNRWITPEQYFETFEHVLDEVPPLRGEEAMYRRFRTLVSLAQRDPSIRRELSELGPELEQRKITPLFDFDKVGVAVDNHWRTIRNGASFGTDYTTRTAVAKSNIFVNHKEETEYYYQDFDVQGIRLDGSHEYEIHFDANNIPKARGFWSITLYDHNHHLYQNDQNRYSFGSLTEDFRTNPDGSFTIRVQNSEPLTNEDANWLPAPAGAFSLYIRIYWPEPDQALGWVPPAVVRK